MGNKTYKKEVVVISDDLINRAITAIESIEPTQEELEAEHLAKLIPALRMAIERGESHDKIRKKVKSVIPTLHYTKIEALLEAASKIVSEHHDHAVQNDLMADDEVHHEPRV